MVKHVAVSRDIKGTDLKSFEGWLREPEIYVDFHKRFNKNDRIKITPWKLESRSYNRESVQLIPLRAPGIIRKAIGAERIRVKEFHTAEFEHPSWAPARDYPEDDSPEHIEAVIFTTQLCFFPPWKELIPFASCQISYRNHPILPDTVQVKASLSCSAEALKWLWVLHGVIEKTMLAQAKENITALIDYFQEGVSANAHRDTTPRAADVVCEDADTLEHEHPGEAPTGLAERLPGKSPRRSPRSALSPPLSPPSSEGSPESPRRPEAARVPESPRSVYYDAEEDAFSLTPRGSIENGGFGTTPRASMDNSAFSAGPRASKESAASAALPALPQEHGASPAKAPSKAAKQKKPSPVKRIFCCFSPCGKPESKAHTDSYQKHV